MSRARRRAHARTSVCSVELEAVEKLMFWFYLYAPDGLCNWCARNITLCNVTCNLQHSICTRLQGCNILVLF